MVNYVQRARDVRHILRIEGMERGTAKMLELLAEDNEMLRQEMQQMHNLMNKMADIVADIATVGAKMKHEWAEVRSRFHPQNEASEDVKQ